MAVSPGTPKGGATTGSPAPAREARDQGQAHASAGPRGSEPAQHLETLRSVCLQADSESELWSRVKTTHTTFVSLFTRLDKATVTEESECFMRQRVCEASARSEPRRGPWPRAVTSTRRAACILKHATPDYSVFDRLFP